jgi:hypothetical protein
MASTRIPTEATKQIKIDTKNSEVNRIAMELHLVEIRLYGRDLPKRLCMRIVSGNSSKGMITSMSNKGRSTLLRGRNKVKVHLLPNILMEMDTIRSTHPLLLHHGNR